MVFKLQMYFKMDTCGNVGLSMGGNFDLVCPLAELKERAFRLECREQKRVLIDPHLVLALIFLVS